MKKSNQSIVVLVIAGLLYLIFPQFFQETSNQQNSTQNHLEQLISTRKSGQMIQINGEVIKLLRDDLEGDKHQKFLIETNNKTLLIAHNIDLAKRVPIIEGDFVDIYGQYEWNEKGGVIHWTHRDPNNRHAHGWIKHKNKTYH